MLSRRPDLEAHGRDARVHEAPMGLGELVGDDEVPADQGAHHDQESGHGQA